MNRKGFIKSIAGLVGIATVAPIVLLSRLKDDKNKWKSYTFKTDRRLKTDMEDCYTRGFWQQIEVDNIKPHKYKPIDFEKFLLNG